MSDNKIIKNDSKGYGYNYASLADMAKQDVKIPQMTTKMVDGIEFVFYKDGDEWFQGARVVILEPEVSSKTGKPVMNNAQAYGAGLTYARRYTVALANSLVTDDDDLVENTRPSNYTPAKPTEKQINLIKKLASERGKTQAEIDEALAKVDTARKASALIDKMTKGGE